MVSNQRIIVMQLMNKQYVYLPSSITKAIGAAVVHFTFSSITTTGILNIRIGSYHISHRPTNIWLLHDIVLIV